MIHNKIHTHIDIFLMTLFCQFCKILHRTEIRAYLTEICHRITAVRSAFRRIQERHKMKTINVAFFQIRNLFFYTLHISRKIIYIKHHAKHIFPVIPAGFLLSFCISFFQFATPLSVILIHLGTQFREHIIVLIKFHVKPPELIMMFL